MDRGTGRGLGALWPLLPVLGPLAIIALGLLVFKITNGPFDVGLSADGGLLGADNRWDLTAAERRARLAWETSVLILLVVSVGAILISIWSIERSLRARQRGWFYALLVIAALVASLAVSRNDASFDLTVAGILTPTIGQALDSPAAAGKGACDLLRGSFTLCDFRSSRSITNSFSFSATLATAFAIAALLLGAGRPTDGEERNRAAAAEALVQAIHRLRVLLYVAAAVLIAVVLSMGAWLQWPAALAGAPAVKDRLINIASGIGLYWGTTFSLMLAAAYLPAAFHLDSLRRRTLVAPHPGAAPAGAAGPGLRTRSGDLVFGQVPRLLAILSPMLTGALPLLQTLTV